MLPLCRCLEEAILNFAGSVLVISHDRWFLDRVATHILAFEGDSKVGWDLRQGCWSVVSDQNDTVMMHHTSYMWNLQTDTQVSLDRAVCQAGQ